MSAKFPTISITSEHGQQSQSESSDDGSSSNDNDMDYNWNSGAATDVEDFNSQGGDIETVKPRSRSSSKANILEPQAKIRRDNDVTDVEDYNDSDSEDEEKSKVYPELKMSLQEFLAYGLQEQATVNNEIEEKVEIKAGNFLQAQNLNGTNDYLTDCEDYDTDSDIEWCCEKSVCVDLDTAVDDQGKVCIADSARPTMAREESDDNEDVSVFSDISEMASALSEATNIGVRGMSEDEILEMSASEEVCHIACSGSSDSISEHRLAKFMGNESEMPEIGVTFIAANRSQPSKSSVMLLTNRNSFLDIASKADEVLTDVEGLDDSAAENDSFDNEDESDKPIPRAVILAPGDDGACQTDTEDVFCEDDPLCIADIQPVAAYSLPPPHREIVVLREDKFGDTITSVEPMNNEYQFGIYNNNDDAPTDSEDYSCVEDNDRTPSIAEELLSTSNLIESDITVANESFKPALNKRIELHSNAESITDVEEIYMAGTNRRKKLKARNSGNKLLKNKYLDLAKGKEEGVTDVEDMDLSESGLPVNLKTETSQKQNSSLLAGEKVTDIEDLSADDSVSDASGVDVPNIDANNIGLKEYLINSSNVILTLESDATLTKKCPKHTKTRLHSLQLKILLDEESNPSQPHTDVEDIQMPSDVEDAIETVGPPKDCCNCSCRELNDMLNESYTVVHEKSGSVFNLDAEKLHIKDTREIRDAHTDVEYVESDESIARGEKIEDSSHDSIQETHGYDVSYFQTKGDYDDDDDQEEVEEEEKQDRDDVGDDGGALKHKNFDYDDKNNGIDNFVKGVDESDDDDNDNDNDAHIRKEAKILVDKVLEESVQIVSEQQQQQHEQNQRFQIFNQRPQYEIEQINGGYESSKHDYNSESENYAITCDDIGGLEVIKSPTIESMSGKSFDDNMSFTDEHTHLSSSLHTQALTTTTTTSSATAFASIVMATSATATPYTNLSEPTTSTTVTTQQQQQQAQQLQKQSTDGDTDILVTTITTSTTTIASGSQIIDATINQKPKESKISGEDSVVKARRIERKFEKISESVQDIEAEANRYDENFDAFVHEDELSALQGDFSKMSWDDSFSPTTNTLGDIEIGQNSPDNEIQDIIAETGGDYPTALDITPVPQFDATSTDVPTPKPRSVKVGSPTADSAIEFKSSEEEKSSFEVISASKDIESPAPVPKPRAQSIKATDSYKSLTALAAECSDSISLRSLDFTEELSKTDEPSTTDYSVKSQQRDLPTTVTTTTTASASASASEERSESFEPTSEISMDDADADSEQIADKTASFYIGESSRNIITKSTSTKTSTEALAESGAQSGDIEAKDIPLMKEISVDSDENADIATTNDAAREDDSKIVRQGSETRHDLLEDAVAAAQAESKEAATTGILFSLDDSSMKTSTISNISAPPDMAQSLCEDDSIKDISDAICSDDSKAFGDIIISQTEDSIAAKSDLQLEKSEWETSEKSIPEGKTKVIHSPQQPLPPISTESPDDLYVAKTLAEAQESLDAAKNELKAVVKDGANIEESPSQFEFRIMSQDLADSVTSETGSSDFHAPIEVTAIVHDQYGSEDTDISSFIGIPESEMSSAPVMDIDNQKYFKSSEGLFEGTIKETLNKEAVMAHYAQSLIFDDVKRDVREEHGSLGFVSTGTGETFSSSTEEEALGKEEHASLGFISNETAEDFSSMEDYYQEKMVKAHVVTEEHDSSQSSTFDSKDSGSEQAAKPIDVVVHRVKSESSGEASNRWSVPEIDQSSSSESYYRSFEKTESRPLSSDVENIITHPNSSEYQTAVDVSSVMHETTEYMSAKSAFDSSGKTISSRESMKSLDSQSETSANLGSIDVSELSETLVASSTDADAIEAEELAQIRELRADDEDSETSADIHGTPSCTSGEWHMQQSQMKRSQEMIFKPKTEEAKSDEKRIETVEIEEYPKPKEAERAWGYAYPLEEGRLEELRDMEKPEDVLFYHGEGRRSIDEPKLASSLDEGSILSVSMSSTSNVDTVVENFEDMIGSAGSSSLTGIEGFGFSHDEPASSLPEETFVMEMDSKDSSPQDSTATTPPGEQRKRGHKRHESTSINGEALKNLTDKDLPIVGEGKESESESDTDPYESEYARQFRSPNERKPKKKKQAAAEMDHSVETEKRPFTPSQLVAEVIIEDTATEELEAEAAMIEERRPSQNMQDYSNIPDITVTEDVPKESPIKEEDETQFEEKTLYKVRTQEELHKADDAPLHQRPQPDTKEEDFQRLVQEQYKQKLAELQRAQIGDSDYEEQKAPDSPDSFEMVEQPDISDEFVIIEEVAKEAGEVDLGGKSIRIQPTRIESQHDEEVEKIIIRSAPADPKLGSQIIRDDLNFEFEESPPTGGSSSDQQEESDSGDIPSMNKRWVEMQLTDNQLRYPYDLTGGVLEDIKEEDGEFDVGSSRISSFKDSFSSTPEYDVLAARRYYARGEHDDVSMSSLQEFESLEQAISLENRNKTHQGSTDSSNGSFTRRYMVRHSGSGTAQGDDISLSSLKEFEGLETACIEAHLIEIKAKEEAALLSRSDESNKSNGSDRDNGAASNIVVTKVTRTVTRTEVAPGQQHNIETLLKQKLEECENKGPTTTKSTDATEPTDAKTKIDSQGSEKGSVDSLEINKSLDVMTSSIDSFDISKDATTRSDIDSLETDRKQPTREESIDSIENEQIEMISKFVAGGTALGDGLTTTTTTTTTSTDAEGREHTVTRVVTTTTSASSGGAAITALELPSEQLPKDSSVDSLNMCIDQTTSSAGTTATYQTSAGDSQMSGSVTSCASSTLMEDSYPSTVLESEGGVGGAGSGPHTGTSDTSKQKTDFF